MSITQPIRSAENVRALSNYYLELGQHRNHRLTFTVKEKKTGKTKMEIFKMI